MLEINPELGVKELSVLIREAVEKCADFEIIDEEKALRLAREFSRD